MFYDVIVGNTTIRCLKKEEVLTIVPCLERSGSCTHLTPITVRWFSESTDTHTLGSWGWLNPTNTWNSCIHEVAAVQALNWNSNITNT